MDPFSFVIGAMAGATVGVIVMALVRSGGRDDPDVPPIANEIESAPQHDGGLSMPPRRKLR